MEPEAQARRATRREQEYLRRRQEIMNAAKVLFLEKGFRSATLDDIAEQSAFGKGTIYNYFDNKDDLLHAIIFQLLDETYTLTQAAMNKAADEPRTKLLAYARATITHFLEYDEVFLMIMREHNQFGPEAIARFTERYREKLALLTEPLAAGIRSGRIRGYDPDKLAAIFDGIIRAYCLTAGHGVWPKADQSAAEDAALLVSVFFDGIANTQHHG